MLQACESNSADISPETDDCVECCKIQKQIVKFIIIFR